LNASVLQQFKVPKLSGEVARANPRGELGREVTGLEGREKHPRSGERAMGRMMVRVVE
jgi:hypothetical protein